MATSMIRYIGRFSVLPCLQRLGIEGGVCSNRGVGNCWRMLSSLCNKSYGNSRTILYQRFETRINCVTLRYTHTSGDKAMVEFLKDEIKLEKESEPTAGKLPRLKGFELTTAEGPNIVLTRKSDNETITIKLNVNHAVDEAVSDIDESNPQAEENKHPHMLCKPSFVVEINKGGGDRTLAIQCVFPHPDDLPPPDQPDQQYEDLIEIQEVAVLNKTQEWTDDVYSLAGGLMDGNLYDMLLKLLEERGINADLIQQLVEFCTAYEHKKYVNMLEQLQEFAASK